MKLKRSKDWWTTLARREGSDAPESLQSLAHQLRRLSDRAADQIDADRLVRAAAEVETTAQVREAVLFARNRLEMIADQSWHGDGRDLKRSIVGVFAEFDAALPSVQAQEVPSVQCCACGKTGLSTEEDGGPECELSDGRWTCSFECYDAALAAVQAQEVAEDAKRLNAPRHWGEAVEASSGMNETEILPLGQPKLRRAKARRNTGTVQTGEKP